MRPAAPHYQQKPCCSWGFASQVQRRKAVLVVAAARPTATADVAGYADALSAQRATPG